MSIPDGDPSSIVARADAALEADEYEEAHRILAEGLERYPGDIHLLAKLGWSLRHLHRYSEAIETLESARRLAPDNLFVLQRLALTLDADYRYVEAKAVLDSLLEIAPDDLNGRAQLANVLVASGHPDQGYPILEQLTREHPDRGDFWVWKARSMSALGYNCAAVRIVTEVLKTSPHYITAWVAHTEAYYGLFRNDDWIHGAFKAFEISDRSPTAAMWMGKAAERLGDRKRAGKFYALALALQPRFVEAVVLSGINSWQTRDLAKAEEMFERAVALDPDDGFAQGMLLQFQAQELHRDLDLPKYEAAALRLPYARLPFYLGRLYLTTLNDVDGAQRMLKVAAAHALEDVDTLHMLAQTHLHRREWELALQQERLVVELSPGFAEGWRALGFALQSQLKLAEAEEAFDKAVELAPTDARAYYNLGSVRLMRQDIEGALVNLRLAVQLNTGDGESLYMLATAEAAAGNMEEARTFALHAQKRLPADHEPLASLLARLSATPESTG